MTRWRVASWSKSGLPLFRGSRRAPRFRRPNHVRATSEDVLLCIPQQAFCSDIPARNEALRIRREDRKIGRAVYDEAQQLVASALRGVET